jgi:phosphatidylglycerophosphate synthase
VTTLALLSWLSSAVLIWFNYNAFAAILIFIGFVLDCTDGNIARLKKQFSARGGLYDVIADRTGYSSILVTLAVKLSITDSAYVIVVMAGLLLTLIIFFDLIRARVEKINAKDIHDTSTISNFEAKIKAKLKEILPFIKWKNVIIGIGADIEWTLLLIASIVPIMFPFFLAFLIVLISAAIYVTLNL